MNFEKFEILREAKTICEGINMTEAEFVLEFKDFPYTANEIAMVKALPIFEDSDNAGKARMVLNFLLGKGSKIKGLGSQLQTAIISKVTTPYITNDRIHNQDIDKAHADNLRANAKTKVGEFTELETRIKGQMDQIAGNDSRLQKISSIVKNTASLKASKAKLKFLDAEDNKEAYAAEIEKQKKDQEKITDTTKDLNTDIAEVEAKGEAKPEVSKPVTPAASFVSNDSKPEVAPVAAPAKKDDTTLDQEIKGFEDQLLKLAEEEKDIKKKESESQGEQFKKAFKKQLDDLKDKQLPIELDYISAKIKKYEQKNDTEKVKTWEEKYTKTKELKRTRDAASAKHHAEVVKKSHEVAGVGLTDREKKKKGLID